MRRATLALIAVVGLLTGAYVALARFKPEWLDENQGLLAFIGIVITVIAPLIQTAWDRMMGGDRGAIGAGLPSKVVANYLRQVEQHLLELQRQPLGHHEDELVRLEAELVAPRYRILKTLEQSERSDEGKLTSHLVRHLLKTDRPVVVLGDPGAGKSVSLRQVGLRLARRGVAQAHPKLPVYLPLGRFTDPVVDPKTAAIRFVEQSLRRLGGQAEFIAQDFARLLGEGRFVFLLDAMDEMPRADIDRRFAALAELRHYTGNKLLFACRKLDFRESFDFQRAIIQPFDRRRVRRFLRRSLGASGRAAARRILSPANPLRDMAGNPFFLKLMALFFARRERLAASRAELLRELEAQVLDRAHARAEFPVDLADSEVRAILARVAYLITSSGRGVTLPLDAIEASFLGAAAEGGQSVAETERLARLAPKAERVLRLAAGEQIVVLDPPPVQGAGEPVVSFFHHRLQEYYTAVYLDEFRPRLRWHDHLDDIWWQEILVMLVGISKQRATYVEMIAHSVPAAPIVCKALGEALAVVGSPALGGKTASEAWRSLGALDPSDFYGLGGAVASENPEGALPTLAGLGMVTVAEAADPARLSGLSPEPDDDEAADRVRRWLEARNARLLDRAELAIECVRNAGEAAPAGATIRLASALEALIVGGNTLERVRAVELAGRLRGIDLASVLEHALVHGDSWSRRTAIAALARQPIEAGAQRGQVGFVLFVQFVKGELLGSWPQFLRALVEQRRLAFLLPGLVFLSVISIAIAMAPLLFPWILRTRFPDGLLGLSGMWGLGWSTWALLMGGAVALWVYLSRLHGRVPVLRSTLFALSVFLLLPWLAEVWTPSPLRGGTEGVSTLPELGAMLMRYLRSVLLLALTTLALIAAQVVELAYVAVLSLAASLLLGSSRLIRVTALHARELSFAPTYLDRVAMVPALILGVFCLVVGVGTVITAAVGLIVVAVRQLTWARWCMYTLLALGAWGVIARFVAARRHRPSSRPRAEWRREIGAYAAMLAFGVGLVGGLWLLKRLGFFDWLGRFLRWLAHQVWAFLLEHLGIFASVLLVAAVVALLLRLLPLLRDALDFLSVQVRHLGLWDAPYPGEQEDVTTFPSDPLDGRRFRREGELLRDVDLRVRRPGLSARERFEVVRGALRYTRLPWIRRQLYREIAKIQKEMRQERE